MAVSGHYLAHRIRILLLPAVEAYGPCLLNDILPAFSNLEARAHEVADKEFARLGDLATGEDDGGAIAEAAQDKGQLFYDTMVGMRQAVLSLFCVGLFHLVEQQLASLADDASFDVKPSDSKLAEVAGWYRAHLGLALRKLRRWQAVEELQLLANTVKHAEGSGGSAAKQLRQRRPELFENPFIKELWPSLSRIEKRLWQPLAGEGLYVSEEQFKDYAAAAVDLFEALAEYFDEHGDDGYPRR